MPYHSVDLNVARAIVAFVSKWPILCHLALFLYHYSNTLVVHMAFHISSIFFRSYRISLQDKKEMFILFHCYYEVFVVTIINLLLLVYNRTMTMSLNLLLSSRLVGVQYWFQYSPIITNHHAYVIKKRH